MSPTARVKRGADNAENPSSLGLPSAAAKSSEVSRQRRGMHVKPTDPGTAEVPVYSSVYFFVCLKFLIIKENKDIYVDM